MYSIVNENYIIFPVLNNSPIGKELSRQFVCINYPSCLFCEYKKKEQLCVTKRMDGVFDVSFFYDCIPFEKKKVNSNSSKNNVKIDKKNNIPKNENDNNIDVIDNINKELKTTVIMATHDKEIVNRMKKRVISIEHGVVTSDTLKGSYMSHESV